MIPYKLVIMFLPVVLLVIAHQMHQVFGHVSEQPDYVKTCQIKHEDFINCSTEAVQGLFDRFPLGMPEIDVEPLDPMFIKQVKILQGSGPVNVNASLSDAKIIGFGKSKIVKNIVDPVTYDFTTEIKLPKLRIEGKYNLAGKILVIPLKGAGSCWFDATNLDITAKSDVTLIEHDGFHFFNVTGIHVKFYIGGLKLYLGNLFDGIKILEERTNKYLNDNWRLVADSLNPILTKTIEDIMIDILKQVFDNIPANFFIKDLRETLSISADETIKNIKK